MSRLKPAVRLRQISLAEERFNIEPYAFTHLEEVVLVGQRRVLDLARPVGVLERVIGLLKVALAWADAADEDGVRVAADGILRGCKQATVSSSGGRTGAVRETLSVVYNLMYNGGVKGRAAAS